RALLLAHLGEPPTKDGAVADAKAAFLAGMSSKSLATHGGMALAENAKDLRPDRMVLGAVRHGLLTAGARHELRAARKELKVEWRRLEHLIQSNALLLATELQKPTPSAAT